jgi:prepilin-type N-terminal cleavage/methylation domain-containing protein
MADQQRNAGFTLIEMLVALGILVVGVTTLLASLGDSMALRSSTDARLLAAAAVEDLVHQIAATGIRRRADAETDLDLELATPGEVAVPGYSTMRLLPSVEEDKERRDVWLLHVRATWLDRGETITEEFLRVLPRQLPLGARVQRFRQETNPKR